MFGENGKKSLKVSVWKVKAVCLPLISFFLGQCAMLGGPAFSEWYFPFCFCLSIIMVLCLQHFAKLNRSLRLINQINKL